MTKIEVQIVDTSDGNCNVTVCKPKSQKSSTKPEKLTANSIHNVICESINKIKKD